MTIRRYVVTDPPTLEAFNERLVASLLPPSDFVVTAKLTTIDELSLRRGDKEEPRTFRFLLRAMTNVDSPYWYVEVYNTETHRFSVFVQDPETGEITFEEVVS